MSQSESQFEVHEAARNGNIQEVTSLLSHSPSRVYVIDEDGRTPLHWACTMNNVELIRAIIPFIKKDLDELVDSSGWTPVHIVSALGNDEALTIFMNTEPQPDINLATLSGTTALHLAVSKGHISTVKLILTEFKARVNVRDKRGCSSLHRAAASGNEVLVRLLVENKAAINATDKDGWTPLHHAFAEGQNSTGLLLIELGADITIENSEGETAGAVAIDEEIRKRFK